MTDRVVTPTSAAFVLARLDEAEDDARDYGQTPASTAVAALRAVIVAAVADDHPDSREVRLAAEAWSTHPDYSPAWQL